MDVLTTERLVLRPFTAEDEQFVADLHRHPGIVRFLPDQATTTPERTRAQLERFLSYADHPVQGMWCITRSDGTPVGLLMLKEIPFSAGSPRAGGAPDVEIGWRVHPGHEGRGYVTEAAERVLQHAWDSGLTRVIAVTDPENTASQRVCARLGLRDEGLTGDYYDETVRLFVLDRSTGAGHLAAAGEVTP